MSTIPVLFIHGIDDTGRRFNSMRVFLQKKGLSSLSTLDIHPPDGSISMQAMAAQVQQAALLLQQKSPTGFIDLVAYSMGSLAARFFLQRLPGRQQVRRLVTIAGPHHGTLAAWLRCNIGCRQMRPGSDFLKDLNADSDPWGPVQVYSFYSFLDLMIFPYFSSRLPHAQNKGFWVLAHPLTASHPAILRAVYQALTAP